MKRMAFGLSLLSVGRLLAATMTWTGGGEDSLWSNAANWGGTAPGAGDTAQFDGTSAKACTVDVAEVGSLTIASGYTGTITLCNALQVNAVFSQAAGTFTCGDYDLTVGQNGGSSTHEAAAYKGDILLTGGTFNAPSGTLTWKPYRKNDAAFKNQGTFNANGGTVLIDYDVGGHNALSWTMYSAGKTYFNLTLRGKKGASNKINGTLNVVTGIFRMEGCRLDCANASDSQDYTKKPVGFIINGNVEYADYSFGGGATLRFEGNANQTITFSRTVDSMEPRGLGMVIDKPMGKVTVSSSYGKAGFGAGSSDWNGGNTIGGTAALSCIYVKSGELDMSSLDEVQVNSDNGGVFGCEGTVKYPLLLSHTNRRPAKFEPFTDQELRNFQLRGGPESAASGFPQASSNLVSGTLTLDGIAFNGTYDTQINDTSTWNTARDKIGGFFVLGDVHLKNSLGVRAIGGMGKVVMAGAANQKIRTFDPGACLPTLQIDKPAGKVTCVSEQAGLPLMLASYGDSANGGSLVLENGELEFPSAGICFTNVHYQALLQLGGTMNISDVPLTVAHRSGVQYVLSVKTSTPLGDVNIIGQTITPKDGMAAEICGNIRASRPGVTNPHFEGPGNSITWKLVGDRDQTIYSENPNDLFYNQGSSVSGGLQISKTGGKVICLTPLRARNLTVEDRADFAFSITNATDLVSDRGLAGWNDPVVRVSRTLTLPADGTVKLESQTKITPESPTKWNVFSYGTLNNFATTSFTTKIPGAGRVRMKKEETEKLLYLSYKVAGGLAVLVR